MGREGLGIIRRPPHSVSVDDDRGNLTTMKNKKFRFVRDYSESKRRELTSTLCLMSCSGRLSIHRHRLRECCDDRAGELEKNIKTCRVVTLPAFRGIHRK